MRPRNARWPVRLLRLTLPAAALAGQAAPTPPEPRASAVHAAAARGGAWRSVVWGRLPNGPRYAVLPRPSNEPGVALLLRVEGGFIAERRPGERVADERW